MVLKVPNFNLKQLLLLLLLLLLLSSSLLLLLLSLFDHIPKSGKIEKK